MSLKELKMTIQEEIKFRKTYDPTDGLGVMHEMTDKQFKRMFRLTRKSFYHLLEQIQVEIEPRRRGKITAINRSNSSMTAESNWLLHLDGYCN